MKVKNSLRTLSVSIAVSSLLIGCGGGGSSSGGTSGGSLSSYSGSVIDGYISGATVCLDLNLNGTCDTGEPSAQTDANGGYSFDVTEADQSHANFDVAPIIASGGTDIDTGKAFEGKLEAPKDEAGTNLTPITTLISKMVTADTDTSTTIEEKVAAKKAAVEKVLGISNANADFIQAGDKDLNKAALQIQKTVELLAQAANDGNTAQDDVMEKVIETIADKIEELKDETDTTKLNVSNVIDETITEASTEGSKIRTLTGTVLTTNVTDEIKKVSDNIDTAFDNMQLGTDESFEDLVDKIIVLVEEQVNDLEEAIENDTEVTLDIFADDDDAFTKTKEEMRIIGLQKELDFLGVTGDLTAIATALAAITEPELYPYNLYEEIDASFVETYPEYSEIKDKIDAYLASIEEKEKEEEILKASTGIALPTDATFYDFWREEEWNDETGSIERFPMYAEIAFNTTTNTFSEAEYAYDSSAKAWVEESETDDDYVLTSTGWVMESQLTKDFTVNSETNVITIPKFNENATIVEETDLSGKNRYFGTLDRTIEMPEGSKEYLIKIEALSDSYGLYEKAMDYSNNNATISNFAGLIDAYCGNYTFTSASEDYSIGLSFAGEATTAGYSCDNTATEGTLFEVNHTDGDILQSNAGTWKIEQVEGKDILVVMPSDVKKYSWDGTEEYTIFSSFDDGSGEVIWRGDLEIAGEVEKIIAFNKTAADTIAAAIKSKVDESSYFYALGTKWENAKYSENYMVDGNDAKKDDDSDTILVNAVKSSGITSRAQAKKIFSTPKSKVYSKIRLKAVDTVDKSTGRGAMIAVMKGINEADERIYAHIQLRNERIRYYIGRYDSDGENVIDNEEDSGTIADTQTVYEDGTVAKFKAVIEVVGNSVRFKVQKVDGTDGSIVLENYDEVLVPLDSSFDLGIDELRFRSEVRLSDDTNDTLFNQVTTPTKLRVHYFEATDSSSATTEEHGNLYSLTLPDGSIMYAKMHLDSANATSGKYEEYGTDSDGAWSCEGQWKQFTDFVAVTCEEDGVVGGEPTGTTESLEKDEEIHAFLDSSYNLTALRGYDDDSLGLITISFDPVIEPEEF